MGGISTTVYPVRSAPPLTSPTSDDPHPYVHPLSGPQTYGHPDLRAPRLTGTKTNGQKDTRGIRIKGTQTDADTKNVGPQFNNINSAEQE